MDELIESLVRTTRDLWLKGWAERNAGNVSVRLVPGDTVETEPRAEVWSPIGTTLPTLAGGRFLFTGTGSFMRNIERDPERGLGLVVVDSAGESYRVAWGFIGGGLPTSELMPHLCAHAARMAATGEADRAIIHTHPQNLIALSYALELDTERLTRLLWEMHTECVVVFPAGCGFIRWQMPGSRELAEATAEVLGRRTMAVWQHHGIVAAGPDLEHAFGLIETAEKAAEIYLKAASLGPVERRLTTEQLTALAANFGVEPDREILGR